MSRERPILFSSPMVRAILEGRKTQTRRVVKTEWNHGFRATESFPYVNRSLIRADGDADFVTFSEPYTKMMKEPVWFYSYGNSRWLRCPYGAPGDRLWVRETWAPNSHRDRAYYRADTKDGRTLQIAESSAVTINRWTPAIHMPRWASRITLKVTDVRVERLQEISEADAVAEGVDTRCQYPPDESPECSPGCRNVDGFALDNFCDLWCSINGANSWAANPWVWVVSFERETP